MIELKEIRKQYITGDEVVEALKGVSLSFRENEFVAILGPSGGGKTTLLNIVGGLDHYSSGDLIINGKSTANFKDRDWDSYRNHSIGFIFQSYNLIPHQTVLANVELALTIAGISKSERKKRALEALKQVGLADQIHKRPNQMSGGQMQRVAIARALVNNPDILLADEPTGALDTENSIQIMELLKQVAKDRLVIMVTHNPELAEQYANRIVRIRDGAIEGDTNPYTSPIQEDNFTYDKTGMSVLTSLALSFNNLMSKKARTFLTGFAGSIGIIGIALILALSNGVNKYIDDIQKDSLSSYPLTINYTTSDMSALMTARQNLVFESEDESSLQEVSVMQSMFSSVHTNNLRSFKAYILENYSDIEQDVAKIDYEYNLDITIYSSDTSSKVTKLNPSTLFTTDSSSGSMMSYYSSYMSTFSSLPADSSTLEIVTGRLPESYDECVISLMDKKAVSDYFAYSIGLRDPEQIQALIQDYMLGKEVDLTVTANNYSIEDLKDMSFKVVLAADTYQYNDSYNLWVDISNDYNLMKEVVDNSLDLKVVGIVVNSNNAMETVYYTDDLLEWVITQSETKDIVKEQLSNPDINVVSGKPFESDEVENSFDLSNIFSIDTNALSSAFNINVNRLQISNLINKYSSQVLSGVGATLEQVQTDLTDSFAIMVNDMVEDWLKDHGYSGVDDIDDRDIDKMIEDYMKSDSAQQVYEYFYQQYGLSRDQFDSFYTALLKTAMNNYGDISEQLTQNGYIVLSQRAMLEFLGEFISSDEMTSKISGFAQTIVSNAVKDNFNSISANLSKDIMRLFASSISVDANKMSQAFSFNFDEKQLSNLLSSYMTESASLDNNLKMFGYADFDNPYSISIYFNNFEAKANVKDWIGAYNEKMGKEYRISYTDLTGILMSSVSTIVDTISYVLIAFVSISLIVSSIMIAIITYVSVLERTKEIGVLRALGASKGNITQVFNAETFIIGLVSGGLGIGISLLLLIPINSLIHRLANETVNAILPFNNAAILILISIVLTMIAGLVPSRLASKKDPVIALRTE